MKVAIKIAREFSDNLLAQAKQRHALGDYDGWRTLNAQALAATRLEMRFRRMR